MCITLSFSTIHRRGDARGEKADAPDGTNEQDKTVVGNETTTIIQNRPKRGKNGEKNSADSGGKKADAIQPADSQKRGRLEKMEKKALKTQGLRKRVPKQSYLKRAIYRGT